MVVPDAYPAHAAGSTKPDLDPTLITVYSTRMSPFCQRVRALLNVKKIPYQVVNISIWQKPDWFLTLTPVNKVPVLVEPNGRIVSESLLIAQYLEEQHRSEPRLLPADPYQKAQELILMERIMQAVADPVRNVAMKSDKQSGLELIKALQFVNSLLQGNYFAGDHLGFVDLMVYPWFDRSPAYLNSVGVTFSDEEHKLEKLSAWRKRMLSDPAIAGSAYPDAAYAASIESRRSGKPNPDVGLDIQKAAMEH